MGGLGVFAIFFDSLRGSLGPSLSIRVAGKGSFILLLSTSCTIAGIYGYVFSSFSLPTVHFEQCLLLFALYLKKITLNAVLTMQPIFYILVGVCELKAQYLLSSAATHPCHTAQHTATCLVEHYEALT